MHSLNDEEKTETKDKTPKKIAKYSLSRLGFKNNH